MCSDRPQAETKLPHSEQSSAPAPLELLEREICSLAAHLAAATCRWLLLIAEFDERLGWAEWGVKSCAHWLSWRCSVAPRAAREHVRVARRLRELPLVRDAFACGELSYSKVRALTRVASGETEADLLEIARHATGAQLEKLVRAYGGALSATLQAAQLSQEQRFARWHWEDDGSLRLEARLPAEDGALLLAAIEAQEQCGTGTYASQRRADGLAAVARNALAAGGELPGAKPAEVVVHVDVESLKAEAVAERCEIADGPAIAPETARRLACDGAVVRILERDGRPLSVGRRTRAIAPALRRALRSRDQNRCAYPGCDHRRFLHAHHIRHWAHGGPTELENLVQLCPFHHRLVHEGGFRVERGHSGIAFRRPDGRRVPEGGGSRGAWGPGVERQNRARGLRMDGDTCRPRSAGDSIDYGLAVELLIRRALGPP